MTRVSVVGTVHAERGLANVAALHAILERIRPQVIFLEIPSAAFDGFRDGTRSNLEFTAASRYQEEHPIEIVPVDLPTPDGDFFGKGQYLFERIERVSLDYRLSVDWNTQATSAYGFAYLNSEWHSKLEVQFDEAVRVALERLGEPGLVEIHESWKDTIERRDKAMMKNIKDYCLLNPIDSGVFLVGSAHRRSIISKAQDGGGDGSPRIEWDFSGFLDGASREDLALMPDGNEASAT